MHAGATGFAGGMAKPRKNPVTNSYLNPLSSVDAIERPVTP